MRKHTYVLALGVWGLLMVAGTGFAHAQACVAAGGATYVFDILAAGENSQFRSIAGVRVDDDGPRPFDGTIVILSDQQGNQVLEIGINEQLGRVSSSPHPFATTLIIMAPNSASFIRTAFGAPNTASQQSQGEVTNCPQSSS